MPVIEALRRHHQPLGIGGILGHPLLACRQIPGGCRVADADEAETLASSSDVRPDDHASPGVNGAG